VATGESGTVLKSTSGTYWSTLNVGNPDNLEGVTFGEGLFMTVGSSTNYQTVVYVSPDGVTWHDRSSGAGTGAWRFQQVEYCNNMFLASGNWLGIRRSEDLGTSFTVSSAGTFNIQAFAYGRGIYFAAGKYNSTPTDDINLVSDDGINWSMLPAAQQSDRNAAVFFKNAFITVGRSGSIWRSAELNTEDDGWALWQAHHHALLGPDRGVQDDPDKDGVKNLLEYALGTDPSDMASVPSYTYDADNGGYLTLSAERRYTSSDILYSVERSTNLVNGIGWDSQGTVVVEDSRTNLTVRSAFPTSAQEAEFLGLKVSLEP
jgi:hypothetical protein